VILKTGIYFRNEIYKLFLTNVFSVAGRDRWIYGWSFAAI